MECGGPESKQSAARLAPQTGTASSKSGVLQGWHRIEQAYGPGSPLNARFHAPAQLFILFHFDLNSELPHALVPVFVIELQRNSPFLFSKCFFIFLRQVNTAY
jgi:hypothetical protein